MSVLNDVATENGLAIREMAKHIGASDARSVFCLLKGKGLYRMEQIEYSMKASELPKGMAEVASHYWTVGNDLWWGLPGGTFEEFLDRLLETEDYWLDMTWNPPTERLQNEERARDLVLVSYLFPFSAGRSSPWMTLGFFPIIAGAKEVYAGSAATARMVDSVNCRGDEYGVLSSLRRESTSKVAGDWIDFSSWATYFELATSISPYDAPAAGAKVSHLDEDRVKISSRYLALAELSNIAAYVIRSCRRRGTLGKNLTEVARESELLSNSLGAGSTETYTRATKEQIHRLRSQIIYDFTANRTGKSCVYRNARSEEIRAIACGEVCLIRFVQGGPVYLFTTEDLRNLKFVSMSHTMWHYYAATLKIEWAPKSGAIKHNVGGITQEILSAVGQLGTTFDNLAGQIYGIKQNKFQQKVVNEEAVATYITDLWSFYAKRLSMFIRLNLTDYLGRYLHDLFAVYTSVLAGSMSSAGYLSQRKDVEAFWRPKGVPASRDIDYLIDLFRNAPMTIVQDFGRLSKIVYAYDINPAYSFMDRCNNMKIGNPRGVAEFRGEFDWDIRDFKEGEKDVSMDKLQCAITMLLAIGDARAAASAHVPAEDAERMEESSWAELVAYFGKAMGTIRYNSQYRDTPVYPVPDSYRNVAKRQAKEFYKDGKTPTSVWAGAYMDIEDMLAYKERGNPDLALLKATSMPSSNFREVMSDMGQVARVTPTRDTDGMRPKDRGDMISDYLTNHYPSRTEAIDYLENNDALMSTSVKIETNKYPQKNRIITAAEANSRRVMSEFEFNNGIACKKVPGFSVGADPAKTKKKLYAAMRDDVMPGRVRVMVSLDLSSWSTGMHWDVQKAANQVLELAYDGGRDMFRVLDKCTKGSLMVMAQKGLRLPFRNVRGANYEGLDGKRNTLIHCALWLIARCDAYEAGLDGGMKALLYIDDGAAIIDVDRRTLHEDVAKLRDALMSTYVCYGFKISMLKTVVSTIYVQFLNEVYYHGAHIGYGFRALCHTGAQTFPEAANVTEELAVISSGIRGAAVSGGHTLRLMAGYHHLLMLYSCGVIGNRGRSLARIEPLAQALAFMVPTDAGGFGLPSMTELFSNLAGHPDVEKKDKLSRILKAMRLYDVVVAQNLREMMKECLLKPVRVKADYIPSRLNVQSDVMTQVSVRDRAVLTAEGALRKCRNPDADILLSKYISKANKIDPSSFPAAFISAMRKTSKRLPVTLVSKALASDPADAIAKLVKKIVSSNMISRFIKAKELASLKRKYYGDALARASRVSMVLRRTMFTVEV